MRDDGLNVPRAANCLGKREHAARLASGAVDIEQDCAHIRIVARGTDLPIQALVTHKTRAIIPDPCPPVYKASNYRNERDAAILHVKQLPTPARINRAARFADKPIGRWPVRSRYTQALDKLGRQFTFDRVNPNTISNNRENDLRISRDAERAADLRRDQLYATDVGSRFVALPSLQPRSQLHRKPPRSTLLLRASFLKITDQSFECCRSSPLNRSPLHRRT